MAKYKVGDKVRIVSERPESLGFSDEMVRFLGQILTVKSVATIYGRARYYFEEAHAESPIVRMALEAVGVPGYYFLEDWISGPAGEAPEEPLSAHIRFCGDLTVAELVKDGKVVKVENARRNPKDTYSRSEGARVAVERLFAKKEKPAKPSDKVSQAIKKGVQEAMKTKIGDKFVVTVERGKSHHYFKVGEVVTLVKANPEGMLDLVNKRGITQTLYQNEVRPYKEGGK